MESLAVIAQSLSSLDHALLLSLIAKQHCLIETTRDTIEDVAQEIQLVKSPAVSIRQGANISVRLLVNYSDYRGLRWIVIRIPPQRICSMAYMWLTRRITSIKPGYRWDVFHHTLYVWIRGLFQEDIYTQNAFMLNNVTQVSGDNRATSNTNSNIANIIIINNLGAAERQAQIQVLEVKDSVLFCGDTFS